MQNCQAAELIARVKGYIEHPEILNNIQKVSEPTLTTVLEINSINESSLHWSNDKKALPCVTIDMVESYVKTRKQAAQAMQEKGYRIFASRRIVSVQTAIFGQETDQQNLLVKTFVRPSMVDKPARPLWVLFTNNKPTQAFCRCPAGKSGLCCHVSTTLYALEEYNWTSHLSLEVPCTSKLQSWHKNKPWKGTVSKISDIKVTSATKKLKQPQKRESRPLAKKVNGVLDDSTKYSNSIREQRLLDCMSSNNTIAPIIEKVTRGQRNNPLWHQYRQYRITSSNARKLLHSTDVGRPALINKIMILQPVNNKENTQPALLYGINNEEDARKRYSNATGQAVQECGSNMLMGCFWLHQMAIFKTQTACWNSKVWQAKEIKA